MYLEKEEYAQLIRQSPLFGLNRETESSAYQKHRYKLIEYLYCYLALEKQGQNEEYGCEIVEVADACINSFNPENGDFLNYFTSAWKRTYKRLKSNSDLSDKYGGMHISENDRRLIKNYVKFVGKFEGENGEATNSEEFDNRIATALDIPVEMVKKVRVMMAQTSDFDIVTNEDDDERTLFDAVSLKTFGMIDESGDKAIEWLNRIEEAYIKVQERQKKLLAKLITAKISLAVMNDTDVYEIFIKKAFFDETIFNRCVAQKEDVTAKVIAKEMNLSEPSVSRTWKTFIEKILK